MPPLNFNSNPIAGGYIPGEAGHSFVNQSREGVVGRGECILKAKLAFPVVALVTTGTLLFAGVAEAAADTKVTIKGPQGDFHGKIQSESSCVAERNVKVYKVKASGDQKIGSDTSDADGEWSAGNTGYKNGRFYAKATRSNGCKAGRSKTIKLVDGVPQ